jgi:hypothetical protein
LEPAAQFFPKNRSNVLATTFWIGFKTGSCHDSSQSVSVVPTCNGPFLSLGRE